MRALKILTIYTRALLRYPNGKMIIREYKLVYEQIRLWLNAHWVTCVGTSSLGLTVTWILMLLLMPFRMNAVPLQTDAGTHKLSKDVMERPDVQLESYLSPLKSRMLFKPSVPVAAEASVTKTTAQQLAQRLQFIGISGGDSSMVALIAIPGRGPGMFRAGDKVAEFTLKDVKKDQLTLELDDEQVVIKRM